MQSERSPFSECATHVVKPNNSCQSLPCHSDGVTHSSMHDYKNLCKTYVLDGTATFPLSLWEREQLCEQVEHTTAGEGATHVVLSNNSCQFSLNYCEVSAHPSSGTMCHILPHKGEWNDMLKHGGQSDVDKMLKQVQHDINIFLKRTYSPTHLFTYSPRKRAAFTLAEVLITLGIIGVVAAMTISTLIANYQKKQVSTKVKHTYSLLQQAFKMAETEYGEIVTWDLANINNSDFYKSYMKPYLNIIKEFDNDFPEYYHAYCRDDKAVCDNYAGVKSANSSKFILSNGTLLIVASMTNTNSVCKTIITDINGLKGPNVWGKDIFIFSLDNTKGVMPYGLGVEVAGVNVPVDKYLLASREYRSCRQDGVFCAALMAVDSWEITDDYGW